VGNVSDVSREHREEPKMSQQELAAKIMEVAQELYELRDGERKDEETSDQVDMNLEILQGELENW
jgi:ribosome-binding protein aMBF1 (putative translation factor)